jgi:uncharacterized BrkB/YihY/UPF0761 family membrane protein
MKANQNLTAAVFFVLTFFSAGGATVESFVNYPTWLLIGKNEFPHFHQALGPRIVVTMVIPLLLSTVMNIALFWSRPPAISRWSVWATLLLALFIWVASILVQIPIQTQLDESGFSREAIEKLIETDLFFRTVPGYLRLALSCWMLLQAMQSHSLTSKPSAVEFER